MSQRYSGYARVADDDYQTPEWVSEILLPHLRKVRLILEPASAGGKMARVLEQAAQVITSDISRGTDFLSITRTPADAIITNPPYRLSREFVERALELTEPKRGLVAMLLRTDYDQAKTRRHLFADHPAFAGKLVLLRRIRWFEGTKGHPSYNHCWYLWDWQHR